MKLIAKQVGGEKRVAVLDDNDLLQEVYIQRDSMLNLDERVAGIIRQKNELLRGYFVQTDTGLSVFVPSKEPYAIGARVVVEITKEARRGKDANGIFTSLAPAPAPDRANLLSIQMGLPVLDEWDTYELDAEIADLLNPHVSFKDSAGLIIEHTAVCHTIDVDTGATGKAIDKLNQAAALESVRQIRLRGLAGVILIDFAGRKGAREMRALVDLLKKHSAGDKRLSVMGVTALGLVEIRRSRTYASLGDLMTTIDGHLNPRTVAYHILDALKKTRLLTPVVRAHPTVVSVIQPYIPVGVKCESDLNIATDFYEIKDKK